MRRGLKIMANWNSNDVNQPRRDSKTVGAALSSYEEALFTNILKKDSVEKAQARSANDVTALKYLFSIFH